MKDNKIIATEATENAASKEPEVEAASDVPAYDPDDYLYEYYDSIFHFNENCLSCKHWLIYDCGAVGGPCSYESF